MQSQIVANRQYIRPLIQLRQTPLARRHQPTLAKAGQSGYEPAIAGKARGNWSAICKIQGDFETKTQIGESGFRPHGVLLVQMDDCCVFATAIDEDNIGYR